MVANRRFGRLSFILCVLLAADLPAWLLGGVYFPGARLICGVLDTLYYCAQIIFCCNWLLFSIRWCAGDDEPLPPARWPLFAPMAAELLLIITNPFTGWVFSISPENVYQRGDAYLINLLPYVFYIGGALAVAVKTAVFSQDAQARRQAAVLLLCMIIPVCAALLQSRFNDFSATWPFTALCLLMIYLDAQQRYMEKQRYALAQSERELAQSQIAIMLSQIQPHFLYNALGVIQELCHSDPPAAERAVNIFARFLRGNLESLSSKTPIPFERELSHTRTYLAIEALRFGDCLRVEYDINATDFALPTLTLQPIVENAVRYGVTKRENGGTVLISSRETDAQYVITVRDDGVGFDPDLPHPDGRTHIGIQNVRDRLLRMCGGRLDIESTPGVGTVAVITLPKEGHTAC